MTTTDSFSRIAVSSSDPLIAKPPSPTIAIAGPFVAIAAPIAAGMPKPIDWKSAGTSSVLGASTGR